MLLWKRRGSAERQRWRAARSPSTLLLLPWAIGHRGPGRRALAADDPQDSRVPPPGGRPSGRCRPAVPAASRRIGSAHSSCSAAGLLITSPERLLLAQAEVPVTSACGTRIADRDRRIGAAGRARSNTIGPPLVGKRIEGPAEARKPPKSAQGAIARPSQFWGPLRAQRSRSGAPRPR
jgi:hypothetical protein